MRGFRPSGSFAQGGAHSLQSWSLPRARRRIRAQNAEAPGLSAPLPERLVRLTLPRPLGIVFGENGPGGEIVVEELVAEGNAKRSGKVNRAFWRHLMANIIAAHLIAGRY